MRTQSPLRLLATGVLLVAVVFGWKWLAPTAVGGSSSYIITHGISMEPKYQEGDLVIARTAESYAVGDVIAYKSENLSQPVMHRIVEITDEGFVTKGDSNSWLDTDRPTDADVIGEAWLHLPGVGKWLAKARSPLVAAVLISLVSLTFLIGKDTKKRRRRERDGQMPRVSLGALNRSDKTVIATAGGLMVVVLLLTIASFAQPLVRSVTADAPYEHEGRFSYGADVPVSPVYPNGKVEAGRPVFLKLVDELSFTFDYSLRTRAEQTVKGEALMFARVSGATGWKKVIPVARLKSFKGDGVRLEGTLNLRDVQRLSQEVQAITGLPESAQTVELVSRIDLEGDVAGSEIAEQFQPLLSFSMDAYQMKVEAPAPQDGALEPSTPLTKTQPGAVKISEIRPNSIDLLGVSLDVRSLRVTGTAMLLLGLLCLAGLWVRVAKRESLDEASQIAQDYSEYLIPVASMQRQPQNDAVQVKSMQALARLAEVYERMILHHEADGAHSFLVEADGVMYCYRVATQQEPTPAPTGLPSIGSLVGRKSREERRKNEADRLRKELADIEAEVLREKAGGPPEE